MEQVNISNIDHVEKLVEIAKNIKHSGDYGMLWWNEKKGKVFWTSADSDSDDEYTSAEIIKIMFQSLPFVKSVEVENEAYPTYSPDEIMEDDDYEYDNYEDWYCIEFRDNKLEFKRY